MTTSTTTTSSPKPTTPAAELTPPASGAAEPAPTALKKKPGRKKTKTTDGEEKVVSLGIPEDLLKKVRVLSALTGESISSMVVSALSSKVKRDLRAAMANLDD